MASIKTFKVNVVYPGTGPEFQLIDAVNASQARKQAEARFKGAKIGSVNLLSKDKNS